MVDEGNLQPTEKCLAQWLLDHSAYIIYV